MEDMTPKEQKNGNSFLDSPHVVELMLREQEKVQGKRDLSVFENDVTASKREGGFVWSNSSLFINQNIAESPGAEPGLLKKIEEYPEDYKGMKLLEDLGVFAKYQDESTGEIVLVHNMQIFKLNFYNILERGTA